MLLEQHLKQLVEVVPLELTQDEKKQFHLTLSPALKVTLKELEEGVRFFAQICPCPERRREELFILLMKANFLGQGTGGSTIGLDADEKFLTLSLSIPYDMSFTTFKEMLEDFVNYVEYWRKQVQEHEEREA